MRRMYNVAKLALSLIVIISPIVCTAANAEKNHDVFSTTTTPPRALNSAPISGNAALGNNSPIARWFDAIDREVVTRQPSPEDKATMAQPFNKDAQRVTEWTNTTANVAKKYREIAKILRSIPLPPAPGGTQSSLASYRKLTANWYDDSAELFEDWIRPRPAASTREELQSQLDEMSTRSHELVKMNENLQAMDNQLRNQLDVRPRDDRLMTFVTKRPKP